MNDIQGKNWNQEVKTPEAKPEVREEFYDKRAELKQSIALDLSSLTLEKTTVSKEGRYLFGILDARFGTKGAYHILKMATQKGFNVDRFMAGEKVSIEPRAEGNFLIKWSASGVELESVKLNETPTPTPTLQSTPVQEQTTAVEEQPVVAPKETDVPEDEEEDHIHEEEAVSEDIALDDQWAEWTARLGEQVKEAGMTLVVKIDKDRKKKIQIVNAEGRKAIVTIQRDLLAKSGGYTDEEARISYEGHEFKTPTEAVEAAIHDLSQPKEKIKITMPWQKHEHGDEHEEEEHGHSH